MDQVPHASRAASSPASSPAASSSPPPTSAQETDPDTTAALPDTTDALPLQTTRTITFTTDEGTWIDLDLSPDGRTIVFELLGDLYTIPVSGGAATRITSGLAYDAQPRFSPGGDRIVFVSDRNGGENVWLANADGSAPEMLTSGMTNRFQSPEWTPDGHIVVSKGTGSLRGGGFPSRQYDQRSYDIMLFDLRGGTAELDCIPVDVPDAAGSVREMVRTLTRRQASGRRKVAQ